MTIKNLTPHAVHVIDGETVRTFESEGIARAAQTMEEAGNVGGIRMVRMSFGAPVDLPAPEEGVYLIVSAITVSAAKASGRTVSDLLLTADPVRDEAGRIIGCKALAFAE